MFFVCFFDLYDYQIKHFECSKIINYHCLIAISFLIREKSLTFYWFSMCEKYHQIVKQVAIENSTRVILLQNTEKYVSSYKLSRLF